LGEYEIDGIFYENNKLFYAKRVPDHAPGNDATPGRALIQYWLFWYSINTETMQLRGKSWVMKND